jgi:RHS repeat-associated protein
VYGTWNSGSSRASNAKYTINASTTEYTSLQNQQIDGGQWNLLGEYRFDIADNANGQNNVSLSAEANGYLIADAIKLELIEENQPAPSGLFFIHNDHLGTPKRLTDTQGQVVWSLQTTPFGEIYEEIANGITLLNGFPGQYRDSETGLSYNYYRDYDPSIGRYIQSDPIGLGGGLNTYGYVGGDPISKVDPIGLYESTVQSWCRQNPMACVDVEGVNSLVNAIGVTSAAVGIEEGKKGKKSAEEAALNKAKNRVCKGQDIKTGDPCEDAKARLNRLNQCLDLRREYRNKYGDPGDQHSTEVIRTIVAVKKAEQQVKELCDENDCPE